MVLFVSKFLPLSLVMGRLPKSNQLPAAWLCTQPSHCFPRTRNTGSFLSNPTLTHNTQYITHTLLPTTGCVLQLHSRESTCRYINYRIRENFRTSNFCTAAKWNISNGFIFELPARPPREKLRCSDALKYVLCRVNGQRLPSVSARIGRFRQRAR